MAKIQTSKHSKTGKDRMKRFAELLLQTPAKIDGGGSGRGGGDVDLAVVTAEKTASSRAWR
jgi:hypothetical protein